MVKAALALILSCLFIHSGYAQKASKPVAAIAPTDCESCYEKKTLTLDQAILLALRTNPNVETSRLSLTSSKFNLWVQRWAFLPHYNLSATVGLSRKRSNGDDFYSSRNYEIKPGITLLTPIGTEVTLSATNNKTKYYNPGLSAQIMQPLMRGFGRAVVENAYYNARDSLYTSGLNVEATLRRTVTEVINAYLEYISANKTIVIAEDAVKRSERSLEQTKLFIKAGRKAGNELVTVEADVATAKSQLENDRNALTQARYALLTAIGLDPNAPVEFAALDVTSLIKKYHLIPLEETKRLALANDVPYQISCITLHGSTTRQLLLAKDQARPQLNLTINAGSGSATGGGWNAGFNSLFNGVNQSHGVSLTLQVPIDDQILRQSILNAKIALRQAELGLKQEKWSKETAAINAWNLVHSAERSLHFAEDAERLQQKTYNVSYQRYLHGLIDSLQLQSAQVALIRSQESLLKAQISYLRALVNLDLLIGHTLKTWDIKVRLG